jgi:hypothetical protein
MTVEIINGSRTSFGPRTTNNDLPASVLTLGVKKQALVPVKFDDLPTHVEGDVTGHALPANSLVTAVYAVPATEAFVGGTSYSVDLVEDDGSSITSIVDAITLAQMNSGVDASLDDATVGSTGPAYIEVTATGTFTAGEGVLVIEYIEQIVV